MVERQIFLIGKKVDVDEKSYQFETEYKRLSPCLLKLIEVEGSFDNVLCLHDFLNSACTVDVSSNSVTHESNDKVVFFTKRAGYPPFSG